VWTNCLGRDGILTLHGTAQPPFNPPRLGGLDRKAILGFEDLSAIICKAFPRCVDARIPLVYCHEPLTNAISNIVKPALPTGVLADVLDVTDFVPHGFALPRLMIRRLK
jgi:hypothetical protein